VGPAQATTPGFGFGLLFFGFLVLVVGRGLLRCRLGSGNATGITGGRRHGLFRKIERRHPRRDDRDDLALIGDDRALRHDGRA
jgi:hypothetical protein